LASECRMRNGSRQWRGGDNGIQQEDARIGEKMGQTEDD